ncbi:MAG: cytosine permease [Methanomassiliicoccales archaeon]
MAVYGAKTGKVEPFGTEHIPASERHGGPFRLFTLWFASNVTIGSYAVGYLAVSAFGLPLGYAIISLLLANVLAGVLLGLACAMGPSMGYPQMMISRATFGRRGGYLPAVLQWASSVGWFSVNAVLGAFALSELTGIGYPEAAIVLVSLMALLGIFGHNLIHAFEKIMSLVLGIFFAFATVFLFLDSGKIIHYAPTVTQSSIYFLPYLVLLAGASLSYLMSWAPYASDYSRYLPSSTSRRKAALFTFLGGTLASLWFEILGAVVAASVYATAHNPASVTITGSLLTVLGPLGLGALAAIVLGSLSANALNIYTSGLAFLVLDVRLKRWMAVLLGGFIGGLLALIVGSSFTSFYEGFLLLLDYWVAPWLAITLIDFYVFGRKDPEHVRGAPPIKYAGMLSYLIGIAVSIPFISWSYSTLSYTGYISSHLLHGADISYYVALGVTSVLYYLLSRRIYGERRLITTVPD